MNNYEQIFQELRLINALSVDDVMLELQKFLNISGTIHGDIRNYSVDELYNIIDPQSKENFNNDQFLKTSYYNLYMQLIKLDNGELLKIIDELVKYNHKANSWFVLSKELFDIMFNITDEKNDILVVECERVGSYIYDYIKEHSNQKFYCTCLSESHIEFYKAILNFENVTFINKKIYSNNFDYGKFDYIISMPPFGMTLKMNNNDLISDDMSIVYTQSLLYYLKENGKLRMILPAKISFAGGDFENFREYVNNNYKINEIYTMTSNVMKPYMMLNTYYMEFTTGSTDAIVAKKLDRDKNNNIVEISDALILKEEFDKLNNWNVDSILNEKSEELKRYEDSNIRKEAIKDVAYVLKGKTITKKADNGNIRVINISNISDGDINYDNLERIEDDIIKNKRYLLEDGDILVTARGTLIKLAVFTKQEFDCIASSNINIIRPKDSINSKYLKLFLESKVGIELLKSIQRGTAIININYKDIETLKVPMPTMQEQEEIVSEYLEAKKKYDEAILLATTEWNKTMQNIDNKLY